MNKLLATPQVMNLKKLFSDFEQYSRSFFQVIDRETDKPVPFIMKPVQKLLWDAIRDKISRNRPALLLVLKSRRLGVTTLVAAYNFFRCLTKTFQKGIVLAHRLDSAYEIYDIYETFYKLMPEKLDGISIKPQMRGTKGKTISFPEISSSIMFASADSREFGRGGGGSFIHVSEAAFVSDLESLLQQIMPRVPAYGDKVVILETTSSGPTSYFYDLWQRSKKGEAYWTPIFFAWFQDPLYRLDDYTVLPESMDDEEKELVERFGLDGSQLAWRRYKIAVDCGGDVQRFRREYPSTEEEAWTLIGRLAWSSELLNAVSEIEPPKFIGTITDSGLVSDPGGALLIWEYPIQDRAISYVIGVDTAEGLSEGHPSAIEVFRVGRFSSMFPVQVAEWHGHVNPLTLAQIVTYIGKMYKNALVAVEINNTGIATENALQRIYFYPNLHRWTPMDAYRARTTKYGWQTTAHSRQVMLGVFDWLISNKKLLIRSNKLLHELLNFQEVVPGGYAGVCGDDRIDAAMIACVSWYQHLFRGMSLSEVQGNLSKFYGSYKPDIVRKEEEEGNDSKRTQVKRWWRERLPSNSDGWY